MQHPFTHIRILAGINEDSQESKPLFITTRKYIRQMVCIFLALFRALFIIERAEVAPEVSGDSHKTIQAMLKQHHVESSMDCFNEIQQIISLAPGMRLVYRTNFAGMYNDISQVIFFFFVAYMPYTMVFLAGGVFSQPKVHKAATDEHEGDCQEQHPHPSLDDRAVSPYQNIPRRRSGDPMAYRERGSVSRGSFHQQAGCSI